MAMRMRIVETGDPSVLELRAQRINLVVFGVVMFALSGFLLSAAFGWIQMNVPWSPWTFGLLAAVCILGGLTVACWRRSVTIDRDRGLITTSWGVVVPWKKTLYELGWFNRVVVVRDERYEASGGSGRGGHVSLYFPVVLEGPEDSLALDSQIGNPLTAKRLAEKAAIASGCPLVDRSSGKPIRRSLDDLQKSLRERILAGREPLGKLDSLSDMKTEAAVKGQSILLHIPPTGFTGGRVFCLVLGAMFAVVSSAGSYSLCSTLSPTGSLAGYIPRLIPAALGLPLGVFLILHGLGSALKNSVRMVASPSGLRIERRGLFRKRVTEMAAAELREVVVFDPRTRKSLNKPYAWARSDKDSVKFGEGLSLKELQWVCNAIKRGIVLDRTKRSAC